MMFKLHDCFYFITTIYNEENVFNGDNTFNLGFFPSNQLYLRKMPNLVYSYLWYASIVFSISYYFLNIIITSTTILLAQIKSDC